ncbi:MAG: FHA domain-containing protein [Planctomycetes bacterium]|nr:FHA domain-containing protein [Planctomycetota bacterium]
MKISLIVLSTGSAAGKALPITTAQFIIGRDPGCNLRPASAMISKRHCAVLVKNGKVFLRDFESTNGTFVNDAPVKGEVALKDGDVLKVGPLSFKLSIEGVPAVTKPTPPPKPKTADVTDEDAAAALLSIDDETGSVSVANAETAEDQVPGGSTVMDMPAFAPPEEEGQPTAQQAAAKAEEKKIAAKSKPATGAAQDAAKAILDKIRQGKRK